MVRLLYQDEIESYFDPAVVMEGEKRSEPKPCSF